MKPLVFILAVTGLAIFVSYHLSEEVTWFTYYAGGIAGLVVGASAVGYWSRRKRIQEVEAAKAKTKRRW